MNTKYLIATATKPLDDGHFIGLCECIRHGAAEHGKLRVVGGIYLTPGPGCNNLAFEIEGETCEAERFINALTMAMMPAKWTTTEDEIPKEDTWNK